MRAVVALLALTCMVATGRQTPPSPSMSGRPIFRGLAVKVAHSRTEAGQDLNEVAKEAAARVGGDGPWRVRSIQTSDDTFRIAPAVTESSEQELIAPGEGWQRAYALRVDPRFESVEPAFAVDGAPGETTELEECVTAPRPTESGGVATPILGATQDSEWSLSAEHGTNVLEAWKKFREIQPGHDVWVGHPDTGYRKHPEIWGMADGPLQPQLGWDFVDNDDDPTDAFLSGTLRWPGHGTKTSSVIVSPKGRQLPGGATGGITGVAPGASLIPLRVANGVVLLDQTNLASAIRAAATAPGTLVKHRVDVISISLGGPPSRALKNAVELAELNGVIVIAAAGNNVRKVVWPARYPNVIAVAASNFDGRVWSGSSGGSMVAIGAPGESVWIANPKMQGNTAVDCLSMSSGTSFATATTAGIAALWVSLHKTEPRFEALAKAGQLTSVFRRILQSTKRLGTNWDTKKYGPGIVDAAAVLAAPLPAPAESTALTRSACDADLEALESLFEGVADPRARVASLFGISRASVCKRVAALGDEIAFHYATNDGVAAGLDRISRRTAPAATDLTAARYSLRAVGSENLRSALPR
jgi:hypothetical protein